MAFKVSKGKSRKPRELNVSQKTTQIDKSEIESSLNEANNKNSKPKKQPIQKLEKKKKNKSGGLFGRKKKQVEEDRNADTEPEEVITKPVSKPTEMLYFRFKDKPLYGDYEPVTIYKKLPDMMDRGVKRPFVKVNSDLGLYTTDLDRTLSNLIKKTESSDSSFDIVDKLSVTRDIPIIKPEDIVASNESINKPTIKRKSKFSAT